ncbi:MAG: glycosyltransferase [Kordiimonas sp.]
MNKVTEVVAFLSRPELTMSSIDVTDVTNVAAALAGTEITAETKKILLQHLQQGRKTKDVYKAIVIESLLLELTKKPVHSITLKNLLLKYKPTLVDSIGTFATLSWNAFSKGDVVDPMLLQHCDRETMRHIFCCSLDHLERIYAEETSIKTPTFHKNNKVVIVTKQIQMPPHAPSVRTFEFAKNLIEDHGKEVLIVCSSENSRLASGPINPAIQAQYEERLLTGINNVSYEGTNLPFKLCGNGIFNEETGREAIRAILDFSPEMILSIGAPNLLGELFHESSFGFFYMSGRSIPITRHHYYHTWDEPTPEDWETLENEGIADQHLFTSTPGYHKPVQFSQLTREQFNIPNDAFIYAVIGGRLGTEVNKEFRQVLANIAEEQPKAHFLFAGGFNGYEKAFDDQPQIKEHCHFIGMMPDIMAVYEICDVYLNPTRKGGGSSAAQAAMAGLPILTLPTGDVGFMAQNFPDIADYDELTKISISISQELSLLETYKEYAAKEAKRLNSRNAYLGRIIDEFEKFAEKRLAEQ